MRSLGDIATAFADRFAPISADEQKYVVKDSLDQPLDPTLIGLPVGTTLRATGQKALGILAANIEIEASAQPGDYTFGNTQKKIPKGVFRRLPQERRDTAKKIDPDKAPQHRMIELADELCKERAQEILQTVVQAVYSEDKTSVPQNPFRKGDNLLSALELAIASDYHLAGISAMPKDGTYIWQSVLQSADDIKTQDEETGELKIDFSKFSSLKNEAYIMKMTAAVRKLLAGRDQ